MRHAAIGRKGGRRGTVVDDRGRLALTRSRGREYIPSAWSHKEGSSSGGEHPAALPVRKPWWQGLIAAVMSAPRRLLAC